MPVGRRPTCSGDRASANLLAPVQARLGARAGPVGVHLLVRFRPPGRRAADIVGAIFLLRPQGGVVALHVSSPIRVVLIDDSDDLRLLVGMALEREPDFTIVAEAGDGESGVAAVA